MRKEQATSNSVSDPAQYVIGVDVGTGSARAGIFTVTGQILASGSCPIDVHRYDGIHVEQSSEDIWRAVVTSVRQTLAQAQIAPGQIKGIGFDATCSLVVLGAEGRPLAVGDPDIAARNVIVWMDHRAVAQAERINATGHHVLDYVGGRISPEMETPKLLWLKENLPETYKRAWQFLDLTDFLTWRATGDLARSICTVTCKWTYLAHERRWDQSYFDAVGLGDLAADGFVRIGQNVVDAGVPLGSGLSQSAAQELGLLAGTPVGAGLIDAHAGGIGTVGAGNGGSAEANLAYVFGTSSCTMTSTREPVFVPGVWGPYYSAMVPGMWLNEGGQSAAGAAIEHLLAFHPYATEARQAAAQTGKSLPAWLAERVPDFIDSGDDPVSLVQGLHVVPEFLGNRAPFADPHCRAVIAGLGMDRDLGSLVALYVAGICGIGYGLRQIIQAQATSGANVDRVVISGGAGRSSLVRQLLSDSTGMQIAVPATEEPVLLGAAILGAVASGIYPDIPTAMQRMSAFAEVYQPAKEKIITQHEARFQVFEQLQNMARQVCKV
ncbi:MAG: FGGY-family carbohydrate kinase [Rhodobacteraceae bacterium]|nr:FGGY-family carbohydrate kinase [Paracoccaceae bacterium]